jgi:hypothetical protein
MRTAGFITRYVLKRGKHHFVPFGLMCVKRPDPPSEARRAGTWPPRLRLAGAGVVTH